MGLGAVVLTGGTAARLGGLDKASVAVAGRTLLEHALAACAAAAEVVVVGEPVPTSRPVDFAREQPPGGGPAAGLLAGVRRLTRPPELVVVLAVDMPRVTQDTVTRLLSALVDQPSYDGAVLVDDGGRRQPLCGVYRRAPLLAATPGPDAEQGLPVRRLLGGLALAEVPAVGDEAVDVDTWADLRRLQAP